MKKFYYFLILQIIFYNILTKTSSTEEKDLIKKIEEFYRFINTQELSKDDQFVYTKFIQLKGRTYDFYSEKNHAYSKNYRAKKQLLIQAIQNVQVIQNKEDNMFYAALNDALIFATTTLKK